MFPSARPLQGEGGSRTHVPEGRATGEGEAEGTEGRGLRSQRECKRDKGGKRGERGREKEEQEGR